MTTPIRDNTILSTAQRLVARRGEGDPVIRLEIYGILILAFAASLLLSLLTFDPLDVSAAGGRGIRGVSNLIGPIGAHVADLFLGATGLGAFFFAGALGWLGVSYMIGRRAHLEQADVFGWLGVMVSGVILLHVTLAPLRLFGHMPGGLAGEYIAEVLRAFLSTMGTVLVALTIMVVSTVALTRRSVFELAAIGAQWLGRGARWVQATLTMGEDEDHDDGADPWVRGQESPLDGLVIGGDAPVRERVHTKNFDGRPVSPADMEPAAVEAPELEPVEEEVVNDDDTVEDLTVLQVDPVTGDVVAPPAPSSAKATKPDARIIESVAMRRSRDLVVGEQLPLVSTPASEPFILPSLHLLDYRAPEGQAYDRDLLRENARILEEKLADYGVKGKVVEIHPGPVITMYEFRPAPGVKISKIANLSDDLAMALSALKIRIVAPIPGKDVVGIEVPNARRETVWLKEILNDGLYTKAKSRLTLALGKDIVGNPTVMDLSKAPHLLVAGATGSGKSVAINAFICSLLYSSTPEDVRMIMIDPKMIELSMYEGIPHLLLPVVTDPGQAATALRWAVKEMERRYRQLADLGVRNLANFNAKVELLVENPDQPLPERLKMARAKRAAAGTPDPAGVLLDGKGELLVPMPQIVVVVDEFADLMMVAAKDVELCVARLAQKARAAGIHLILATQRPSVDVITGMIKANFPTRIGFRVASKVDSRTILDQKGAEALLGMGDMLYLPPGSSAVQRVHGCYVSEDEVHAVVAHLKTQGQPDYDLGILVSDEDDDGKLPGQARDGDEYDELYDQALKIVVDTRNASISFIQRKLKVGYNRAARIVEKMEEEGVVGPSDGTSRPREIFIDPL